MLHMYAMFAIIGQQLFMFPWDPRSIRFQLLFNSPRRFDAVHRCNCASFQPHFVRVSEPALGLRRARRIVISIANYRTPQTKYGFERTPCQWSETEVRDKSRMYCARTLPGLLSDRPDPQLPHAAAGDRRSRDSSVPSHPRAQH